MNHRFNSHRIRCISILGGFLDKTKFELADGLKYFIGARGAGKTTLPAFVRYALGALLRHTEWISNAAYDTLRRSGPSFGTQPDKTRRQYLTNVR
jgi:hypothetical protein